MVVEGVLESSLESETGIPLIYVQFFHYIVVFATWHTVIDRLPSSWRIILGLSKKM